MAKHRNWTWEETLVAFRLYCRTPFGRLHRHNPDIITLAKKLGRTPSAVSMKACNFASLDPVQQARGIKGLPNRSQFEPVVWERFRADSEAIAAEAEAAYERLPESQQAAPRAELQAPNGPTDVERMVRVRRVQSFFRSAVLASYDGRCALTGLAVTELLNASHIVPWSVAPERRADPSNGICLNALHDRAFDRGLITFDGQLRVVLSPALLDASDLGTLRKILTESTGRRIECPARFTPSPDALAYHREQIFMR